MTCCALAYVVGGPTVRVWLLVAAATAATTAAGVRALRQQTARAPWIWMTIALASNAIGEAILTVATMPGSDGEFPAMAHPFYLAFYGLFGIGLWVLARARGRDRAGVIDALIVAVGSSVVIWQFLVIPALTDGAAAGAARLLTAAYPVADLVLLGFLARLGLGTGAPSRALHLLTIGVVALLAADVLFTLADLYGTYSPGSAGDTLYVAAYSCIILAAGHRSTATIATPVAARRGHFGWRRIGLLTLATLLAPVVAIVGYRGVDVPTVASAALFLLVMARIVGLLRTVARSGERRFESLVAKSSEVVAIFAGDRISYLSPSAQRLLGPEPLELSSSPVDWVHPDDRERARALFNEAQAADHEQSVEGELRLRTRDGSWRVMALTITNLETDSDIAGLVINAHDIDELRRLASFDTLTGLANRSEFTKRLTAAIDDGPLALLLFDLDGFKEINDSLGHHAGDLVLATIAARLDELAEPGDTVARLGGDEFALLRPGGDLCSASATAERAIVELRRPIAIEGVAVGVGTSIGIAMAEPTVEGDPSVEADEIGPVTAESLTRDADIALYRAKQQGRGRAVLFEAAMGEPVRKRLALRNALEGALPGKQLDLHYQPLHRLADGRLVGVEALLRWNHPTRGAISPAEFIPAAEESHHIITIGRWVLDQAVRQLASWRRTVPGGEDLAMSVNLSPRQLLDPQLVSGVAGLLSATSLPADRLILEITEQAIVDNIGAAVEILGRLRALGVRLAIDDYGSGNASISYLRQFPVEIVKIDRSLTADLLTPNNPAPAFVRSIVELAGALGVTTIGEGIETPEQLEALRSLGCRYGQGYLLGRPAAAADVTELLRRVLTPTA